MAVLDDVKLLLDFEEDDEEIEPKLDLIIENAGRKVLSHIPAELDTVPKELEYIVCELSVARFNRIGNEGMKSYSQEGESFTFSENDIDPYLSDIEEWNKKQQGNKKGVLRFI